MGGGVEDPPSVKIGYSEPTRAQSREGSSTLAKSSWMFFGTVIFDSDWLPRILIGCRQEFGFGLNLGFFLMY